MTTGLEQRVYEHTNLTPSSSDILPILGLANYPPFALPRPFETDAYQTPEVVNHPILAEITAAIENTEIDWDRLGLLAASDETDFNYQHNIGRYKGRLLELHLKAVLFDMSQASGGAIETNPLANGLDIPDYTFISNHTGNITATRTSDGKRCEIDNLIFVHDTETTAIAFEAKSQNLTKEEVNAAELRKRHRVLERPYKDKPGDRFEDAITDRYIQHKMDPIHALTRNFSGMSQNPGFVVVTTRNMVNSSNEAQRQFLRTPNRALTSIPLIGYEFTHRANALRRTPTVIT